MGKAVKMHEKKDHYIVQSDKFLKIVSNILV